MPYFVGQEFGRWKVIGPPERKRYKKQWRTVIPCRCSCGTERKVLPQILTRTDREELSCGCWKRERTASIVSETRWKDSHGRATGSKDPLYRLWSRIKRRCYNPQAENYRWYGGRGIGMCEAWRNDAGAFIEYVEKNLGPRPSPKHSINRIDNDGNYEPGNVEWADPVTQARNRRSSRS